MHNELLKEKDERYAAALQAKDELLRTKDKLLDAKDQTITQLRDNNAVLRSQLNPHATSSSIWNEIPELRQKYKRSEDAEDETSEASYREASTANSPSPNQRLTAETDVINIPRPQRKVARK